MPYCEHCGTGYKENDNFCENCGEELTTKKAAYYPVLDLGYIFLGIKKWSKIALDGIIFILFLPLHILKRAFQVKWIRRVIIGVISFLVVYVTITMFLFQIIKVRSGEKCDKYLANKIIYKIRKPAPNEMILFRRPKNDKQLVGYVEGFPGDEARLSIKDSLPLGVDYVIVRIGLDKYEFAERSNIIGLLLPLSLPFKQATDKHVRSYEKIISTNPAKLSEQEFYKCESEIMRGFSGSGGYFLEEKAINWLKKAENVFASKGIKLTGGYKRHLAIANSYFHSEQYEKARDEWKSIDFQEGIEMADWFIRNKNVTNSGKIITIVEFPGNLDFIEPSTTSRAEDENYLFVSCFKGPIYRYNKKENTHAIIYCCRLPDNDWVTALEWDGENLIARTNAIKGLATILFNNSTNRVFFGPPEEDSNKLKIKMFEMLEQWDKVAELEKEISERDEKISQGAIKSEEFIEDFESYDNREFLNGKSHWTSSDTLYDKGWMAVSGAPKKYARFWPSPWPGGFSFESNYLTYHIQISGQVNSIVMDIDYFLQIRGGIKVFISGDNSNWKEITDLLDFVKSDTPGERNLRKDLSSVIAEADIKTDLYIMFRAAAYSGDYWVFGLHRIVLEIESISKT